MREELSGIEVMPMKRGVAYINDVEADLIASGIAAPFRAKIGGFSWDFRWTGFKIAQDSTVCFYQWIAWQVEYCEAVKAGVEGVDPTKAFAYSGNPGGVGFYQRGETFTTNAREGQKCPYIEGVRYFFGFDGQKAEREIVEAGVIETKEALIKFLQENV